MKKLVAYLMLFSLILAVFTGCGQSEGENNKGDTLTKAEAEPLYQDGDTNYLFRVQGKYFQKYNGKDFEDYYIKGVNIGSSKPNTFPGELGVTQDEYLKWFEQIGEMHANTIRVYTVMMPAFYDALYQYNTTHDEKLYLFQGCWYNEDLLSETQDAFSDIQDVEKDLKDLVDIIHGNAQVEQRTGHAYGEYTRDVSAYVIGWILGIESDQNLVEGTRYANPDTTSYTGKYLSCEQVEPYEVFWCEIGDYVLDYEDENYHMQRPVSYSNWPTADVMSHPNEPLEKEDAVSLTVDDLTAQSDFKTGIFASYHVYSYYPNFMFWEEPYCSYKDEEGNIDTYLGYLNDLVAHNDCPVLIAEFGIPASRGVTHVNPLTGFNQGAVTAEQQGNMLISMFEDIKKAQCAGGLVFVWEDEWFKRTWNTMDYTNSDYRAYWNDVQTSEQHFGLMEYISTECNPIPVLDGKLDEWNEDDLLLKKGKTKIYAKCDSTYLYLAVQDPEADFETSGSNLYFDINPNVGCGNYGDTKLSSDADFILHIQGKDETRMLVDTASDPYIRASKEWQELDLVQDEKDSFHRIYLITDRSLTYPQTGQRVEVQKSETGLLHYGKVDVTKDVGDVLTDFYYKDQVFEVRIPWGLLGFSAPSIKEINNIEDNTTLTVDGIQIGYLSGEKDYGQKLFTWDNWEQAQYRPHLRKSYYMLQEYLEKN